MTAIKNTTYFALLDKFNNLYKIHTKWYKFFSVMDIVLSGDLLTFAFEGGFYHYKLNLMLNRVKSNDYTDKQQIEKIYKNFNVNIFEDSATQIDDKYITIDPFVYPEIKSCCNDKKIYKFQRSLIKYNSTSDYTPQIAYHNKYHANHKKDLIFTGINDIVNLKNDDQLPDIDSINSAIIDIKKEIDLIQLYIIDTINDLGMRYQYINNNGNNSIMRLCILSRTDGQHNEENFNKLKTELKNFYTKNITDGIETDLSQNIILGLFTNSDNDTEKKKEIKNTGLIEISQYIFTYIKLYIELVDNNKLPDLINKVYSHIRKDTKPKYIQLMGDILKLFFSTFKILRHELLDSLDYLL